MAFQTMTFVATNTPVNGVTYVTAESVSTDLLNLINDYNLQIPSAKLPNGVIKAAHVTAGIIDATKLTAAVAAGLNPAGTILAYGGVTAPTGYLLCQGQVVSQTTYAALFAVISTAYNTSGEGTGNFRLPNLQDNVPVGKSGTKALGTTGGEATHALSTAELASHTHAVTDPTHGHNLKYDTNGTATGGSTIIGGGNFSNLAGYVQAAATGISIVAAGSGTAHNNLQPYQVVNYIIKT